MDIIIWQVKAEIPYLVKASVNIYIQGKNKKKIPLVKDNNIAKISDKCQILPFYPEFYGLYQLFFVLLQRFQKIILYKK